MHKSLLAACLSCITSFLKTNQPAVLNAGRLQTGMYVVSLSYKGILVGTAENNDWTIVN